MRTCGLRSGFLFQVVALEPSTSGYRFVAPSLGVRTCIGIAVLAGRSVPGRGPAGTRWVHTEPAGRGAQRARVVTTGAKEPQVSSPAQPPPGTASGAGPEFESPVPRRHRPAALSDAALAIPDGPHLTVETEPLLSRHTERQFAEGCYVVSVRSLSFRSYLAPALLAVVALAFLTVGSPSKDAVVGAGFALAGAAATRAIDVAHERSRDAAEADANRRRDLDEARRLLYMALVVGRARQHQGAELVATIVNSLVHHQSVVAVDEAVVHVAAVVRGDMGGESERWLEAQIERITHELNH